MTGKRRLSQALILGAMVAMGAVFVASLGHPMQEVFLSAAALCLIAVSLIAERIAPMHGQWNQDAGDTGGDVASFVMIFGVLDGVLKWVSPFAILALWPEGAPAVSAPLWLQIVAVTLMVELGAWASHWAHHRFRPLWALHAMHHSPTRLYTLNNFRFHPFNHVLTHLLMALPPLALGFAPEALLGYAAIFMPVLIFQHSNIGFDFGGLNGILNTNELHRWHHSDRPSEGTKNLGRALIVWDRVFGTYLNPGRGEPARLGLFDLGKSYPASNRFLAQLGFPFSGACCRV